MGAQSPLSKFPKKVLSFIRHQELFQPGDRVLVGVSGGPDSIALLHLLTRFREEWNLALGVTHFEHGLRGRESIEEAAFVADQSAALGLPCYQAQGDVRGQARARKISLQVAARQLRLAFFERLRQDQGYDKLALGHTADDQVELFFLRLLRGSGPEGLKGMWAHSPTGVVRPLLGVFKDEIFTWLNQENLPYRQDSSNLSRNYRRNRLRLELLPELQQQYNPRLKEAVRRTQALLQEQENYLSQETARYLAKLVPKITPDGWSLDLNRFQPLHPFLQKRVLRLALGRLSPDLTDLSWRHLHNALSLCHRQQPAGEITLPGEWRLVRQGRDLLLQRERPPSPPNSVFVIPAQEDGGFSGLGWTLTWTTYPANSVSDLTTAPDIALMDKNQVQFPLVLRLPRPGDRFQPLGMAGSKKLQDFFVDRKLPRHQRPWIPLLLSQGKIIWVVGHCLADPVKVTPDTTAILQITASRD